MHIAQFGIYQALVLFFELAVFGKPELVLLWSDQEQKDKARLV